MLTHRVVVFWLIHFHCPIGILIDLSPVPVGYPAAPDRSELDLVLGDFVIAMGSFFLAPDRVAEFPAGNRAQSLNYNQRRQYAHRALDFLCPGRSTVRCAPCRTRIGAS